MRSIRNGLVLAGVCGLCLSAWNGTFAADRVNLALKKTVTVSNTEDGLLAANLVDGDNTKNKRWGSNWAQFTPRTNPLNDSAWVYVDLGQKYAVDSVCIWWEHSSALHYKVQIWDSLTAAPVPRDAGWTDIFDYTWGGYVGDDVIASQKREHKFPAPKDTRYVRIRCIQRQTDWGYGICELQVFGNDIVATRPSPASRTASSPLAITQTNAGILFTVSGAAAQSVSADIYSTSGRLVSHLSPAANGNLFWNGSTRTSRNAAPGSYIARVTMNGVTTEHAFTLAR
jgi:hypothetical protein